MFVVVLRGEELVNSAGTRLEELARAGLRGHEYLDAAMEAVRRVVPCEGMCLAMTDPASAWTIRHATVGIPKQHDEVFLRYELTVDDVNTFADLAVGQGQAVLHQATGGDPRRSARYRDIVFPLFGAVHELRGVVRVGASVLGTYALYREAGAAFTSADLKRLRELQKPLRAGLHRAAAPLPAAASTAPAGMPFGVLILSRSGALRTATARLAEYLEGRTGRFELSDLLVTAAASASRNGAQRITFSHGEQWVSLDAELLRSGDVSVTIRQATPPEMLEAQVFAYGLTPKELQALRLLLRGCSTAAMAQELSVSPYTVQGYFKSVFDKLGVHSRRELLANFSEIVPRGVA